MRPIPAASLTTEAASWDAFRRHGPKIALTSAVNRIRTVIAAAGASLAFAGPAYAADPIALPDPSGVTLFALGVAGLLIGRRVAGRRRD